MTTTALVPYHDDEHAVIKAWADHAFPLLVQQLRPALAAAAQAVRDWWAQVRPMMVRFIAEVRAWLSGRPRPRVGQLVRHTQSRKTGVVLRLDGGVAVVGRPGTARPARWPFDRIEVR